MKLNEKLGFFNLGMIVISLVIGMGIFQTPVQVAQGALTPSVYFLAWIFGGVMALCGALTFAEIGSRLPVSGGYFRIFAKCYHPAFAFMLNGTILVSNAASVAGVALIGAEYITGVIFHNASVADKQSIHLAIAFGEIVLFLGLNLLGLKTSATTQSILTVFKLLVVLLLISAIFMPSDAPADTLVQTPASVSWTAFLKSLGLCLIPISFTYGGYQQSINFGGEIKNATKILPRAIISGILVVILLYLAINFAYYKVIGFEQLKSSESIASILATRVLGDLGSKILTLMLFFSVLAYVNVGLMANPRVICAMSEDGNLPKFFSVHSKRFDVPVTALLSFAAASIAILFFARTFGELVKYVIFIDALGFIAAASTIFILRKRHTAPGQDFYRIKLFPWIPLLFIVSYAFVTFSVVIEKPASALIGLGILAGFFVLYLLLNGVGKKVNHKGH